MRTTRGRTQRQVRQEGKIIRLTSALLITIFLVSGCGGGKKSSSTEKTSTKKPVQEDAQVINSQAGTAYGWSDTTPKHQLWEVTWKTVQLTIDQGNSITNMKGTHGRFFQDGQPASLFESDSARAEKQTGDIDANDHVVVTSIANKAVLRCDTVHYASKGQPPLVQAKGHVEVQGPWGTVSGLNEVWATPDLKTFGTPDLFQKR